MLLVWGREKVQIALHRISNPLRVHRRNNKMSGFRSLEGCQRGLIIPNLTNKNDIRRLTKRGPQSGRKSTRVTPDLSLSDITAIGGELILDRILDRHDVPHQILVHPLKQRRYSRGFARAGWSGHKNQAVLAGTPS